MILVIFFVFAIAMTGMVALITWLHKKALAKDPNTSDPDSVPIGGGMVVAGLLLGIGIVIALGVVLLNNVIGVMPPAS